MRRGIAGWLRSAWSDLTATDTWHLLEDGLLYELVVAVVTGLMWAVIAAAVVAAWTRRRARRWGIPLATSAAGFVLRRPKLPPVVILASGTRVGKRAQTGVGQVIGLAVLAPSIRTAYGVAVSHDRLFFANEALRWQVAVQDADVLMIGGPKTNGAATAALDLLRRDRPDGLGSSVTMRTLTKVPTRAERRRRLRSGLAAGSDGGIVTDEIRWAGSPFVSTDADAGTAYGLVIRCANPWNTRRALTLVMGSGTHGTEAAARALADCRRLRSEFWRRRRAVAALVAAPFQSHEGRTALIGAPRVESLVRLRWAPSSGKARRR